MPADTSITFELAAGRTADEARRATPVRVTTPTAVSPVDLGSTLLRAGFANGLPYLRVTAVLRANPLHTATPVLREMQVRWLCVPVE
ncbi:MAG: hypothetical protein AB7P00_28950 [Sandaracinaceae bacterium]